MGSVPMKDTQIDRSGAISSVAPNHQPRRKDKCQCGSIFEASQTGSVPMYDTLTL
jgi:hypothetical protein